jgi:outer membrane immunogenic protein
MGLCGLFALAGPARAHGPSPDDYVPYVPSGFFVYDWSGFYAGAHLGAAHTLAESTEVLFPDNPQLFQGFSFGQSETSFTGGIQAGWQHQWGSKIVAGVELGYNMMHFDTTSDAQLIPGLEAKLVASVTRSAEVSDILLLTGKVGYADGRWLAYAKGGLANAEVDIGYRDSITGLSTSSGGRETGWVAGGGVDYALTQNLILGVEYNYIHFSADPESPQIPEVQFGSVQVDVQNVVVRLNYRFNGPCCSGPGGPPPPGAP